MEATPNAPAQVVRPETKPAGLGRITVKNPATGAVLGDVPILGPDEVRAAVARARSAQRDWARLSVQERARQLEGLRNVIVERAEEIVDALMRENGKPRIEALVHEVLVVADLITYLANRAPEALAPREIDLHLLKHRKSYVHYAPRGVVGVISPWNFPFSIPTRDLVTALLAGSAVVHKPSEVTPLVALKAKELFDATAMPHDLYQVVTGDGRTGAALVDGGVQQIVFTGAVATGKKVAAACGERLIPCTVELGGKAPLVVCDDADLERAARAIVWGGFANCGQVCVGVERVYVTERNYDAVVARVVELTGQLRQGDPAGANIEVGAMTFPPQVEIVEKLVEDARNKGARVLTGGKRGAGPGLFFEPTVLADANHGMAVMTDEVFGPVVPIMRVKDEEEALRLANESHLGLAAYVFTRDRDKGRRYAERIEAGNVMVNDVLSTYAMPEAPFGGIKQSGFGRVHGDDGLRDMCNVVHVNYDRFRALKREPTWYPYSDKLYRTGLKTLRFLFGKHGVVSKLVDWF